MRCLLLQRLEVDRIAGLTSGTAVKARLRRTCLCEGCAAGGGVAAEGGVTDYSAFVARKGFSAPAVGIAKPGRVNPRLFPFQRDIVKWALRRGRAAIFSDCGTGKAFMSLEWARHVAKYTGGDVLMLAPLAVAQQTVREGAKFGIEATYCRRQEDAPRGIVVTNYEMLDRFDVSRYSGVVLDESSILKAFDGKTRTAIIESFKATPFRLACTATPAPNDHMELGNHAEFLGSMTRAEMLSMFFVHDGGSTQDWRIKGHAVDEFWRWVCQWAVMIRRPSDLGYSDDGFVLPPLEMHEHVVAADVASTLATGQLFAKEAMSLVEQRAARRGSIDGRTRLCADLVNASDEQWIVWCELNAEGDALERAINGAVQVAGADSNETKESRLADFLDGHARVLISKPSMFGFGLNLQHCRNMAFVGVTHSYEQFYQAIRREWRFGQTCTVNCHVITSEIEGRVLANLRRKEADAAAMGEAMVAHMRDVQREEVRGLGRQSTTYQPAAVMTVPVWATEGP